MDLQAGTAGDSPLRSIHHDELKVLLAELAGRLRWLPPDSRTPFFWYASEAAAVWCSFRVKQEPGEEVQHLLETICVGSNAGVMKQRFDVSECTFGELRCFLISLALELKLGTSSAALTH